MPKLTARKVETVKEPGMYGDGDGLYLRVGPTLAKSWILRTVVHGKRRDLGLGSAKLISLAEARESARELRKIARAGGDPSEVRRRESLTFRAATEKVYANLLPTWRSKDHAARWMSSFTRYVFPTLGARPIHTINSADVLGVLTPIWADKHDTAQRVKQRISSVFDWAKGAGHYASENPVNGLEKALPAIKRRVEHMSSMPWMALPGFMSELNEREGVSARCLAFVVLTATRSKEARFARWSEIDGDVWTIPANRMKRGVEHRVPLSTGALAELARVRGLDDSLIFPSANRTSDGSAKPMSDTVFSALTKRMGRTEFTTHGFRSTFRDWCGESAKVEREVAEAALSHAFGDRVERAYARSDLFDRRRDLMQRWSDYASRRLVLWESLDGRSE